MSQREGLSHLCAPYFRVRKGGVPAMPPARRHNRPPREAARRRLPHAPLPPGLHSGKAAVRRPPHLHAASNRRCSRHCRARSLPRVSLRLGVRSAWPEIELRVEGPPQGRSTLGGCARRGDRHRPAIGIARGDGAKPTVQLQRHPLMDAGGMARCRKSFSSRSLTAPARLPNRRWFAWSDQVHVDAPPRSRRMARMAANKYKARPTSTGLVNSSVVDAAYFSEPTLPN